MTKNKITSVTSHVTGEGNRLSYTYSVIDVNTGNVVSDNNRKTIVVIDGVEENDSIIKCIQAINNYVLKKLESE